jgi:hypothetical protein
MLKYYIMNITNTDYYKYFFGNDDGKLFAKLFLKDNSGLHDFTVEQYNFISDGDQIVIEFTYFIQSLAARLCKIDKLSTYDNQLGELLQNISKSMNDDNKINVSKINNHMLNNEWGEIKKLLKDITIISDDNYKIMYGLEKKDPVIENFENYKTNFINENYKKLERMVNSCEKLAESNINLPFTMLQTKNECNTLLNTAINSQLKLIKNTITEKYYDSHTTLYRSDPAKDIFKNVYLNWDKLSANEKRFYHKYITVEKRIDTNTWIPINENDYIKFHKVLTADYNNYRLNLNKGNSDNYLIKDKIKLLSDKILKSKITKINYFNHKTKKITTDDKTLINLFDEAYAYMSNDDMEWLVIDRFKSPLKRININDLIIEIITALQNSNTRRKLTEYQSDELIDLSNGGIWFRYGNDYIKSDANGKFIKYGIDDDVTRKLLKKSCYSTGLNVSSDVCRKYLYECLLDDDNDGIEKWLELVGSDFNKIAVDEIKNMHPMIAQMILKKYEFYTYKQNVDKFKSKLKFVENIKNWKDTYLKQKFNKLKSEKSNLTGADTFDDFCNINSNLILYLSMICDHVNKNPGILNAGPYDTFDIIDPSDTGNYKFVNNYLKYELDRKYDPLTESLNIGCPPFMINSYGPDIVCKSSNGIYITNNTNNINTYDNLITEINKPDISLVSKELQDAELKDLIDKTIHSRYNELINYFDIKVDFNDNDIELNTDTKVINKSVNQYDTKHYINMVQILEKFANICHLFKDHPKIKELNKDIPDLCKRGTINYNDIYTQINKMKEISEINKETGIKPTTMSPIIDL